MTRLDDELLQLAEERAVGQELVRQFSAMKKTGEATQEDVNDLKDAVAVLGGRYGALYVKALAEANSVRLSEATISATTEDARATLDTYYERAAG